MFYHLFVFLEEFRRDEGILLFKYLDKVGLRFVKGGNCYIPCFTVSKLLQLAKVPALVVQTSQLFAVTLCEQLVLLGPLDFQMIGAQ